MFSVLGVFIYVTQLLLKLRVPIMPMDTGSLPLPRQCDDVTGADRAKYGLRYYSGSVT